MTPWGEFGRDVFETVDDRVYLVQEEGSFEFFRPESCETITVSYTVFRLKKKRKERVGLFTFSTESVERLSLDIVTECSL